MGDQCCPSAWPHRDVSCRPDRRNCLRMEGGWKVVTLTPRLRIRSPVDVARSPAHPVDSKASLWEGQNLRILVDEGPFSDPLTSYGDRVGAETFEETIDGRPARVVSAELEDGSQFAGAHFGLEEGAAPGALTITVTGSGHLADDVPLEIVRSVEFI